MRILLVLLPVALLGAIWLLGELALRRGAARREGQRLGLHRLVSVRRIEGKDRGGRWTSGDHRCVGYRLPVVMRAGARRWTFRQGPSASRQSPAPGWTLDAPMELPAKLIDTLRAIAEDWVEDELLQVESDPGGLTAYWDEWGGAARARRVHDYLTRIAAHDPNVERVLPNDRGVVSVTRASRSREA